MPGAALESPQGCLQTAEVGIAEQKPSAAFGAFSGAQRSPSAARASVLGRELKVERCVCVCVYVVIREASFIIILRSSPSPIIPFPDTLVSLADESQ